MIIANIEDIQIDFFIFRKYRADRQAVDEKTMNAVENESFELDHITLVNDASKY